MSSRKGKHYENLELEILGLRKELEKTRALNLRFAKWYENSKEIIKVQCYHLVKIGLGYNSNGES